MENPVEGTSKKEVIKKVDSFHLGMLNDECLEYIIHQLELTDQLSFSLVCRRFKNIFVGLFKNKYKNCNLELFYPLSIWERKIFLLEFGPYIESIEEIVFYEERVKLSDYMIDFIGRYCTNLRSIAFKNILNYCIMELFEKLQNFVELTHLNLSLCDLTDDDILILEKLSKLEYLAVDNNHITGQYIARLTTVKDLIHKRCDLTPFYFTEIIISLKDLQSLDIQHCALLLEDTSKEMLKHCLNLESLKISSRAMEYESIARLPKLKQLNILPECGRAYLDVHPQLFEGLMKHKADQLESLQFVEGEMRVFVPELVKEPVYIAIYIAGISNLKQLCFVGCNFLTDDFLHKLKELKQLEEIVLKNSRPFTNEGLLEVVESCTKLKRANIELCRKITDMFVLKAIHILESMKFERGREDPCLFFVARSGISQNIITHPDYKAAVEGDLLKLSFDEDYPLEFEVVETYLTGITIEDFTVRANSCEQ